MKICSKCKVEKSFDFFHKDKTKKNGITSSCKDCHRIYYDNKIGYLTEEQKTKRLERGKLKRSEYEKKYYINNKEHLLNYAKNHREANKQLYRKYSYEWREKNREKYLIQRKIIRDEKMKNDVLYRFTCKVRGNITKSFKRGKNKFSKPLKTESILGCTIEEFIKYIESKFKEGMTLNNHGEWHLDHIYPISLAKSKEEIIKLNHYTNFQPLWAEENIRKGNRLDY